MSSACLPKRPSYPENRCWFQTMQDGRRVIPPIEISRRPPARCRWPLPAAPGAPKAPPAGSVPRVHQRQSPAPGVPSPRPAERRLCFIIGLTHLKLQTRLEITNPSFLRKQESRGFVVNQSGTTLTISVAGFPPRIKYGVTPCQARGDVLSRERRRSICPTA